MSVQEKYFNFVFKDYYFCMNEPSTSGILLQFVWNQVFWTLMRKATKTTESVVGKYLHFVAY